MNESKAGFGWRSVWGGALVVLGVIVFAIRLQHDGAYAVPRGGNLFGGLGSLVVGGALLWRAAPRALVWVALAASPFVVFSGLYATASELEEVVSLYATDQSGRPAELRLWIVDRDDGAWMGMPGAKAAEHGLDGARLDLLRDGETRCVELSVHDDRETARAIHAMKMEKYAVARVSSAVGLYPSEARETTVAVRAVPCS